MRLRCILGDQHFGGIHASVPIYSRSYNLLVYNFSSFGSYSICDTSLETIMITDVTIKCKKCGDEAYLMSMRPGIKDLKEIKYCVQCGSTEIEVKDETHHSDGQKEQ